MVQSTSVTLLEASQQPSVAVHSVIDTGGSGNAQSILPINENSLHESTNISILRMNISKAMALEESLEEDESRVDTYDSRTIIVKLPGGDMAKALSGHTTPEILASEIRLAEVENVIIARVDGELWDLDRPLQKNCSLIWVRIGDDPLSADKFPGERDLDDEDEEGLFVGGENPWHSPPRAQTPPRYRNYGLPERDGTQTLYAKPYFPRELPRRAENGMDELMDEDPRGSTAPCMPPAPPPGPRKIRALMNRCLYD